MAEFEIGQTAWQCHRCGRKGIPVMSMDGARTPTGDILPNALQYLCLECLAAVLNKGELVMGKAPPTKVAKAGARLGVTGVAGSFICVVCKKKQADGAGSINSWHTVGSKTPPAGFEYLCYGCFLRAVMKSQIIVTLPPTGETEVVTADEVPTTVTNDDGSIVVGDVEVHWA